jgi:hypothetical protein
MVVASSSKLVAKAIPLETCNLFRISAIGNRMYNGLQAYNTLLINRCKTERESKRACMCMRVCYLKIPIQ